MYKFTIVDSKHYLKQHPSVVKCFYSVSRLLDTEQTGSYVFDVSFIDDITMKRLNHKHRKINKTTDVISFAFHDQGIKTPLLGEIFINYLQAQRQAKENKHSLEYELVFLFTHGLLHLLGYNHDTKQKQHKMFGIQEKIMRKLKVDQK